MNPLHNAIIKRQNQQLAELLAAGADPEALTANGRNARELAEFVGNLPALVLLQGQQVLLSAPDHVWVDAVRRGDYQLNDIPPERLNDALCDEVLLASPPRLAELPASYRQLPSLRERCRLRPDLLPALPDSLRHSPDFFRPLLPDLPLSKWPRPWPQGLIDCALQLDPESYTVLNDSDKTGERSQQYLRHNGGGLWRIPEPQRTYEMCLIAMQTGYELDQVPAHLLNDTLTDMALANLQQRLAHWQQHASSGDRRYLPALSPETLALIPTSQRSYNICLAAVSSHYGALWHVPEDHKTLELCCTALDGRELIGIQINDIAGQIPPSLREQVLAQANFQHHIQPGELDDWDWD